MNILIDTHILIWYIEGNSKLSKTHQEAIDSEQNTLFVSMASLWEMAIKLSINKLKLNGSLENLLPERINILPIDLEHILQVQSLPFHHSDPFDRLIIAQAMINDFEIMTVDEHFADYLVSLI